jgi:hypothetical protein
MQKTKTVFSGRSAESASFISDFCVLHKNPTQPVAGQMMTMRLLSTLALAALVGAQHQPDHCDRVLGKACGAARAERKECEECLEKMESKDGCS